MASATTDDTVLAAGSTVFGQVADRNLTVRGNFDGEIELTGRLHVADGSSVKARVKAAVVEIYGEFEGELRATTLRLGQGARARGLFFADRIAMSEGARLDGDVNRAQAPLAAVVPEPEADDTDDDVAEAVAS